MIKIPKKYCLFALLVTAGILVFFFEKEKGDQPPSLFHKKISSVSKGPLALMKNIYTAPRVHIAKPSVEKCLNEWEQIRSLDLALLNYPPKFETLPRLSHCKAVPSELLRFQNEYKEKCQNYLYPFQPPQNEEEWTKSSKDCLNALFFLRVNLTDWLTRDERLSEIADLKILADKLIAQFTKLFAGSNGAPDTSSLTAISERMLEIDPKLYGAAKAAVIASAMEVFLKKDSNPKPEFWEHVERTLRKADELNPNDSELDEMAIAVRTHGMKPELLKPEAEKFIQSHPDSGIGYYYLASSEWRNGNTQAAKIYLTQAIERQPNESRFQKTWDEITKPNAKPGEEGHFILNFSFNIHSDDVFGK